MERRTCGFREIIACPMVGMRIEIMLFVSSIQKRPFSICIRRETVGSFTLLRNVFFSLRTWLNNFISVILFLLWILTIIAPQLNCPTLCVEVLSIRGSTILIAFLVGVIPIPHIALDLLALLVRLLNYSIIMSIRIDVAERVVE